MTTAADDGEEWWSAELMGREQRLEPKERERERQDEGSEGGERDR